MIKNRALKREILHCDAKNNRILWMIGKLKSIDKEMCEKRDCLLQIEELQANNIEKV